MQWTNYIPESCKVHVHISVGICHEHDLFYFNDNKLITYFGATLCDCFFASSRMEDGAQVMEKIATFKVSLFVNVNMQLLFTT
jgi:hypothetical protein